MDSGLVGNGEVECGTPIGCVSDEMRRVVGGDGDGDRAVGGAGGETRSLPGGAVELGLNAAVGGGEVDVAGEFVEADTAVGSFATDGAIERIERKAAVRGVKVGGEAMGDVE